jgi:pimeloyl-ACP methyl ester carboxylesterase
MTSSAKPDRAPTLILVHGAFHHASTWRLVTDYLPGVTIQTVQLPSSASVPVGQLGDMYADAQAIRSAAEAAKGPVVVCAHSYGAVPTSEGVVGLDAVKRLVFLNSFLLEPGASMLYNRGGTYPPHWDVRESEGYILMRNAEDVFYNDLPADLARAAAADLGPQSLKAMQQPLTRAAWQHIPNTYVIGEQDHGLPSAMRELFASRAQNVRRMPTSHSPFLSQPAETAKLLREELDIATES